MKRKRRQNRRRRHSPAAATHKVPVHLSRPRVVIDPGRAWFAVCTATRGERRVEAGLARAGLPCYLPSEVHKLEQRGEARPVERLAISRYVFVGLSAGAPEFGIVHAVDGVQALVAVAGTPLRIPASALQAFADTLARKTIDFRGGAVGRLIALMAEADDARARERGPFWSEAA